MVYNNPATANVDLKPELVARIAEIAGCDYIKESTLEVTRVRDILRLCGDRMLVFGGILGVRVVRGRGPAGWRSRQTSPLARWRASFELAADEGRIHEARTLYLHWLPIIEAVYGQR